MTSSSRIPLTRLLNKSIVAWRFLVLLMILVTAATGETINEDRADHPHYMFLGVSGGLQDGFPDHVKLDYTKADQPQVQAVFIGKALVRGTKAYLDVMQQGWRQYTVEPGQPLINANVVVSGCAEHANEYWVYAVDTRQVLTVLNNEPRFLSITPDTALVDLTSSRTDAAVRALALDQVKRQNKSDMETVALPIVVSTWYNAASYVPSPPVTILEDGTAVTNFAESLALWAAVNDTDRTCVSSSLTTDCTAAHKRYWQGIRVAVRTAEEERHLRIKDGPTFSCQTPARLGVGPDTARINYSFAADSLRRVFGELGYHFNVSGGTLDWMGDANDEL